MKNVVLFCLLFACFGFESCKKNQNATDAARVQAEKPISVQCYQALFEKDTIDLEISTLQSGKITGNMVMNVLDMPKNIGKIKGEFRGDTLFADYSFIKGTYDKVTYKNPLAILKKGNELILGNGRIETYLGVSYFVKGVPIDFDNVKYKFITVDCVDKK